MSEQPPAGPPPYGQGGPPPPYGYPPPGYAPPGYAPPGQGAPPGSPAPPYGYPPPGYGAPPPYGYGAPPSGRPPPTREWPPYPHAQPEPYHRILRTWSYRPWRVLVGLPVALLAGVVIGPLLVALLVALGVQLLGLGSGGDVLGGLDLEGDLTPPTLLIVNLSLAALIPVTWLAVRYLHNLRPRWLGSVRPGVRWGWFGLSLAAAVVATLLSAGLASWLLPSEVPTGSGDLSAPGGANTVAFLLIIALTSPLQAAGEEYFFRGYLLQGFGALVRARWFTLVCTSLLFAVAHGSQNLPLFVDRFAFGLVAGGLVMLTGGLEAGIAMHVVNNVLVLGLAAASGTLTQALSTSEASWSLVAFDLGQFVLYAVLVALMCRWRRPRSRTPGPPASEPATPSAAGPAAR
jgi:uncharacterized protein